MGGGMEGWRDGGSTRKTYETRRVIVTASLGITQGLEHRERSQHHLVDAVLILALTLTTLREELHDKLGSLGLTGSGLSTIYVRSGREREREKSEWRAPE